MTTPARRLLAVSVYLVAVGSLSTSGAHGAVPARSEGAVVALAVPGALAVSHEGVLYVVDWRRDQILRRMANGRFRVVAGTGRRGFSGDGHLATHAEISVGQQSGLAVAGNGAIYFGDVGNERVREVLPNGVIETVAGGGSTPLGTSPVPARRARLGPFGALALGPGGQLYIGAAGVYELADGSLVWVVGSAALDLNRGFRTYGANPAFQRDLTPAYTVAVDGAGDVLVGGGQTWSLYERTTAGVLRFVQEDRAPGGYYAAMATAPDGSVVIAGGAHGLARFRPSGRITSIPAKGLTTILPAPNYFTVGEGVAVAPNGTIYLVTDAQNGFSNVSAIVEVALDGRTHLVWMS